MSEPQPIPQTGPSEAPNLSAEDLVLRILEKKYREDIVLYLTPNGLAEEPSGPVLATFYVADEKLEWEVKTETGGYRIMHKGDVLAAIDNPIQRELVTRAIQVAEQYYDKVYYELGTLTIEVYKGDFEEPLGKATVEVLAIESQLISEEYPGEAQRIANILRKRIIAHNKWLAKYVVVRPDDRYKADVAIVLPISVGELAELLRRV